MTLLSDILPTSEAVECVVAIAAIRRDAAVLLLQEWQAPDGILESFEWCQGPHEGCRPAICVGVVGQTQVRVETYRQGRLV